MGKCLNNIKLLSLKKIGKCPNLKETRNSSKIRPLDFEKNDSSTQKNVPHNTNEHTRLSPLHQFANLFTLKRCLILRGD